MTNENIERLSLYEQNLSAIVSQKQSFQKQILEIDNAVKELEGQTDAYHIVGTVMVKKSSKDLKADLEKRKEVSSLKIESLEKQEKSIREQLQALQEEVVNSLQKGKNDE